MRFLLNVGGLLICALACALPAAAQLDSYALRAKYGEPLHRETFRIPAGFDLVVDYGTGGQVCSLEVPALARLASTQGKVVAGSVMERKMYDFLADLVPDSMRGMRLSASMEAMGAISVGVTEYERVTIRETRYASDPLKGVITVVFKGNGCPDTASR